MDVLENRDDAIRNLFEKLGSKLLGTIKVSLPRTEKFTPDFSIVSIHTKKEI